MHLRGLRSSSLRACALQLTLVLLCLTPPASAWEYERVDSPRRFSGMSDRSSCLDSSGNLHVAYGEDGLFYTWYDGVTWRCEIADPSPGVGKAAALALDSAGIPHVSYLTSDGKVKYATKGSSGWFSEVALDTLCLSDAAIAVDSEGRPHLAAVTEFSLIPGYAFHALKGEAGWEVEVVDLDGNIWHEPTCVSFQIDEAGRVCLAYWLGTGVRFASKDSAGWHVETAVTGMGYDVSLAMEPGGVPHIAFVDGAQRLGRAFVDTAGWHVEIINTQGASQPSIRRDSQGRLCVSYARNPWPGTDGDLMFAIRESSGWYTETVDMQGSVGFYSALSVGGDAAFITYLDETNNALKLARQGSSGWTRSVIDRTGPTGYWPSLDLRADGSPAISASDIATVDLKFSFRGQNGWQVHTVDSSELTWLNAVLAIDSTDRPHLYYRNDGSDHFRHACLDGGTWEISTIEPQGDVPSLVLDSLGYAHLSYYGYAASLWYAFEDALGWHIEVVDSDYVNRSSLALDTAGYPHIAYSAHIPQDLRYAFKDGAEWNIELVDSVGYTGVHMSLAIDEVGTSHVAYFDFTRRDLRYARRDSNGWTTEAVDTLGEVGYSPDLALDGNQQPHIAYFDFTNGDLKYAIRMLDGWHVFVAAGEGRTGLMPSLCLDEEGTSHVAYHDSSTGCLMYAHHAWPPMTALIGYPIGPEFHLQWSPVALAESYWVYGTSNEQYFTPGMAPDYQFRLAVLPAGITTWLSPHEVGSPAENWTYLVMAVDAEAELCRSNRVGEFDVAVEISRESQRCPDHE